MTNAMKKIIEARLTDAYGAGDYLDYINHLIIDVEDFDDLNDMFRFIVCNYKKIIIL